MEQVLSFIQKYPEITAIVFAVINALWLLYSYLKTQKHTRELEALKQALNLDLERRKKLYELKLTHYESYFDRIDAIHNKHQNDYQEVLIPIIKKFNNEYQTAELNGDKAEVNRVSLWFSDQIRELTINGFKEVQIIEQQTNSLKLSASAPVSELLDELRELYQQMFNLSSKQISLLVSSLINKDFSESQKVQEQLMQLGNKVKCKSNELRECMRKDLQEI